MANNSEDELLELLSSHLGKTKSELVREIEGQITRLLGKDVGESFETVAAAQQIRGGHMNLDRAHKSMLVLLAHILERVPSGGQGSAGEVERVK
jgi:predicted DNA-binding protein